MNKMSSFSSMTKVFSAILGKIPNIFNKYHHGLYFKDMKNAYITYRSFNFIVKIISTIPIMLGLSEFMITFSE